MAKLGEKIFEFKEVFKFFRIPVSCTEDKSFLNVGKNSVIKVHDQKPLHTWTLTHPHYFTCPVVYAEGNIYCVMDYNVLLRWTTDEDNLKKAEKVKFQDGIFAVIPVQGEQPLVLFNSGKYAMIDATAFCDLKPFDFVFLKENEEIVWVDASSSATSIEVFCLACNQKNKNSTIYYFTVNKKDKVASNLHNQTVLHEKASLKSWCLNHHNSSFLTLWSNGMICSHNVKDSKDTKLLSIKDIDVNSIVAIDSIDSSHIVVASGSSKQNECVIEIWDSTYSVLKARKVLKTPDLDYIQITVMNSNMFLSFNKELISVTFNVENSLLSAAVHNSLPESNKIPRYSWDTRKGVLQTPSSDEPDAMDVCDQEFFLSKLDSLDSIELIAQRLLNKNLEHVQESELAKLLQLAVKYKKEENDSGKCSKKETYILLNIIFSSSFDHVLLVKYLKRLNSEEVLITLELLLTYLNQTVKMPSNVTEMPSNFQIVNWSCLIIQSHMEILYSKDKTSRKIVKQLENALFAKMEEYQDLEEALCLLSVMKKKDQMLPPKCPVRKYCIETLDI